MKNSIFHHHLLRPVLWLLLAYQLVLPCQAQQGGLFIWKFSNAQLSRSLPSCGTLDIEVTAPNSTARMLGQPPFSMIAYPEGGTPTTQLIGTNDSDLSWVVDQPIGSSIMLTVIDGNGNPGGIGPSMFTVIAGQTTSCLQTPPSNQEPFTVTSNITDRLETCQPWGITVKGGVPPYNVTLAALNSPVITNVTIGLGDDVFTYINRADPDGTMIAGVVDFQGRWASGTPLVHTYGSNNVDCVGLVSSTGNSTEIAQAQQEAEERAAADARRRSIIIGVTVSLGVVLLLAAAAGFWFWRRRREREEIESGPDLLPRQFEETRPGYSVMRQYTGGAGILAEEFVPPPGQVLMISPSAPSNTSSPPRTPKSPTAGPDSSTTALTGGTHLYPPTSVIAVSGATPYDPPLPTSISTAGSTGSNSAGNRTSGGSSTTDRPGFNQFPQTPSRRNAKAIEAGFGPRPQASFSSQATTSPSSPSTNDTQSLAGTTSAGQRNSQHQPWQMGLGLVDEVSTPEGEVVIQHRDAGLPRELPPPYADRGQS
ncbi:hypothetical protein AX16_007858 [Volvariella volvacea WC 439]|nr:hypothetical protein AX16_007858 [Volvariella volvacea WC 439]